MEVENKLQAIVTDIATTAAQGFLSTLPPEAAQTLSPKFLRSLSQDVQAELQSAIQSRLQWSLQAVKAELDEQQRQAQHRKHVLVPKSAPRKQTEAPGTPFPSPGPNLNDVPPSSQPELPLTAGLESLKPYQRRRGKEPQLTREEIMKAYSLSPTDFALALLKLDAANAALL